MYQFVSIVIRLCEMSVKYQQDFLKSRVYLIRAIGWSRYMLVFHGVKKDDSDFYKNINIVGRMVYEGGNEKKIDQFLDSLTPEINEWLELARKKKYKPEYLDRDGSMIDYAYVPGTIATGIEEGNNMIRWIINMPPFALAEEKQDFFKIYRETRPDECMTFEPIYEKMLKIRNENIKKSKERQKGVEKEYKEAKRKKEEVKKKKEEQKTLDVNVEKRALMDKDKLILGKFGYDYKKAHPELPLGSWNNVMKIMNEEGEKAMISRRVKSKNTAIVYACTYARSINDEDFVKEFWRE